jgi:flagellar biosynthesis protein FlhG
MNLALSTLPRSLPRAATPRNIVAIASGKGGVGKTWLAITLSHAMARRGRRALLFDADLGLANVDIQLGLMPSNDLGAVLSGRLSLPQVILPFSEGGFDIIAGRSGCGRLAGLASAQVEMLADDLARMAPAYDTVIVDLGAGVEHVVRRLTRGAGCCLVVITDEPTSLTDAYVFVKLTSQALPDMRFPVVVNMAGSKAEGERTFATFHKTCDSFLSIAPTLLGVVRRDRRVREAIRGQAPLLTRFPASEAAADVEAIAARLTRLSR